MRSTAMTRRLWAVSITSTIGWALSLFAIKVLEDYAIALFVWLPIVMGASSSLIVAHNRHVNRRYARDTAFLSMAIFCIGLIVYAIEGFICVLMAAPIGLALIYLGHRIGYSLTSTKAGNHPSMLPLLILSVPAFMAFESDTDGPVELHSVTTSIIIDASREDVWQNVIAFPKLGEPEELLFKSGIAYPIDARINGQGVGAIRYCNFSTGSFVEPITKWNKPDVLAFDVVNQPPTMKELSPYDIHPNHLRGYFVSEKGEFRLVPLTDGRTRLEGTTWYYNRIRPNLYWNLWSDYIIHKIHYRVLDHIKQTSEGERSRSVSK